jgi:hypothetical protein
MPSCLNIRRISSMIALARWLSPTMRLNAARASSISGRSRDSQRWPASAFAAIAASG